MSDEKDNVIGIGGNVKEITSGEDLGDTIDRVKRLLTPIIGSQFVLMYYSEDGAPNIVPSEELTAEQLVFLGEALKMIAMNSMGIYGID